MSSDGLYQESVSLPSKGLLYSKEDCPTGVLDIRAMTTGDESLMQGATKDNVDIKMNKMIHGCIQSGWNTSLGRMSVADRMFLLYRLRILTHGGEYTFSVECSKCDEESNYRIDLDKLPITVPADGVVEPLYITLPICKKRIGWRFLRVDDEAEARVYKKQHKQRGGQYDPTHVFQFARRIVSIDGEEDIPFEQLFTFVSKMHAKDSRQWEKNIAQYSMGVETQIEVTCRECGRSHIIDLPVDDDFFRPSLADEQELSAIFAAGINVAYNPNETPIGPDNGDACTDEGTPDSGIGAGGGGDEAIEGRDDPTEEVGAEQQIGGSTPDNSKSKVKPKAQGTPGEQDIVFDGE